MKHTKDMWDKLESIFGDGTSNKIENKKKWNKKKNKQRNEKKGFQDHESQPQVSQSSSAHDSMDDEKK